MTDDDRIHPAFREMDVVCDPKVPVDYCVAIRDGKVVFCGLLDNFPRGLRAEIIVLHPDDYKSLNEFIKRRSN